MHILWLTGRESTYPRNDVLLRAFQRLGTVDVVGGIQNPPKSLLLRSLRLFLQSLPFFAANTYDLVFVGFFGHFIMLPVRMLSRKPILFDAFVSTFDTICYDRQYFNPESVIGRLSYWLDRTACLNSDWVLLDTQSHVNYFQQTLNLQHTRFSVLPVGCNESIFFPRKTPGNEDLIVLFYSSYQPLHGVETIIRAASLLAQEPGIIFRLVGCGQTYQQVRSLAEDLGLTNISFLPFVTLNSLPDEIAAADICLGGHFGVSDKAHRVIPGKIYQILSMKKPLIASNTQANLELLRHEHNAYLCPVDDPESLADAIRTLHKNPAIRAHLANNAYGTYLQNCSEQIITEVLSKLVGEITR
jgi:glycosyltransferase involved in cell wall biosynthesis